MVSQFTRLLCMTGSSTALAIVPVSLRITSHTFYIIMLQLIICFHMPHVKKVLEKVFSAHKCTSLSQKMLTAHWCSANETENTTPWMLSFRSPSMRMFTMQSLSFNMPPPVKTVYFITKNILETTGSIVCTVGCWTVLLRQLSHNQTGVQKMCVKH